MNERDRLQKLLDTGKLDARDAADIEQLLASLERRDAARQTPPEGTPPEGTPPEGTPPEGTPPATSRRRSGDKERWNATRRLKLRFLSFAIDERDFRMAHRRVGVLMGVLFGLFMGLILTLPALDDSMTLLQLVGRALSLGLLQGILFGSLMYVFVLRPPMLRTIQLRNDVGVPLEPLTTMDAGHCPTCAAENASTITRKNPMMLHWIINPGLAINEVFLGQRIPAEMHRCRECGTIFVNCDNCKISIDSMVWSGKAAFGHFHKLPCPGCQAAIPSLRNLLTPLLEKLLGRGKPKDDTNPKQPASSAKTI